jgi:hypothetical protein
VVDEQTKDVVELAYAERNKARDERDACLKSNVKLACDLDREREWRRTAEHERDDAVSDLASSQPQPWMSTCMELRHAIAPDGEPPRDYAEQAIATRLERDALKARVAELEASTRPTGDAAVEREYNYNTLAYVLSASAGRSIARNEWTDATVYDLATHILDLQRELASAKRCAADDLAINNGNLETIDRLARELAEARAVHALLTYGADAFIKAFYAQLGKQYMQPYEAGLRSFLDAVTKQVAPQLVEIQAVRDLLSEAARAKAKEQGNV